MTPTSVKERNGTESHAAETGAAERDELVRAVADFAQAELAPSAEARDHGDEAARRRAWEKVCDMGLQDALSDATTGDSGHADASDDAHRVDTRTALALIEEVAVGDAGVAMALVLHGCARSAAAAAGLDSAKPAGRWVAVPPSQSIGAAALSAGGDYATVTGALPFVLAATDAAAFVALATGSDRLRLSVVDAQAADVEISTAADQLGLRAFPAASVRLSSAAVHASAPVAARAESDMTALLNAATAAVARGIARRAFRLASEYASQRMQGGIPIVGHDAVRLMLARMRERLDGIAAPSAGLGTPGMSAASGASDASATSGALPAASALDPSAALAVKLVATDAALDTAIDAVQTFGGAGYMEDSQVERAMRDAKYCQLFPEPNLSARLRLAPA